MAANTRDLDNTTTSMDMMALNNLVVSMRKLVKQCRVQVIQKLAKQIKKYRSKRGSEDQLAQNNKKANRLHTEIDALKHVKDDRVAKYALGNTGTLDKVSEKEGIEVKVLTRVACHKPMSGFVTKWRSEHEDWKALVAFLLYKNTGRRMKKDRQKAKKRMQDSEARLAGNASVDGKAQKSARKEQPSRLEAHKEKSECECDPSSDDDDDDVTDKKAVTMATSESDSSAEEESVTDEVPVLTNLSKSIINIVDSLCSAEASHKVGNTEMVVQKVGFKDSSCSTVAPQKARSTEMVVQKSSFEDSSCSTVTPQKARNTEMVVQKSSFEDSSCSTVAPQKARNTEMVVQKSSFKDSCSTVASQKARNTEMVVQKSSFEDSSCSTVAPQKARNTEMVVQKISWKDLDSSSHTLPVESTSGHESELAFLFEPGEVKDAKNVPKVHSKKRSNFFLTGDEDEKGTGEDEDSEVEKAESYHSDEADDGVEVDKRMWREKMNSQFMVSLLCKPRDRNTRPEQSGPDRRRVRFQDESSRNKWQTKEQFSQNNRFQHPNQGTRKMEGATKNRTIPPLKNTEKEPAEKLHPSWEASKRRKQQLAIIPAFQGKKIKFDD